MRVDIVTLFPELFAPFLRRASWVVPSRAGSCSRGPGARATSASARHRSVDDTPYGGGSGMVMRVDCLVACLESLDADAPAASAGTAFLLTPQGARAHAGPGRALLARRPALTLVCGRYEGFDERVRILRRRRDSRSATSCSPAARWRRWRSSRR